MNTTTNVTVYLGSKNGPHVAEELQKAAERAGMKVSEFIRTLILRELKIK